MPLFNEFDKQLDLLMSKVKKGQMTREEYSYISSFLGNVNLLVFGTGHDSPFWRFCNSKGKNLFLEHDPKWIPNDVNDVYQITYTCEISNYQKLLNDFRQGNTSELELSLPKEVEETHWDVIIVDGPPGNKKNSIGRMQSIYTAYKISSKYTEIFIHDCDRPVESEYATEMFSTVTELTKLRHCENSKNEL